MSGRHSQSDRVADQRVAGALRVEAVEYVRAGRVILDKVTMAAQPGEVTAIVGPSGSGKSSLLTLMAGLERPDGGSIAPAVRTDAAKARQGLVLQGYGLVGVLTAAENIELPLQAGEIGKASAQEIRDRSLHWMQVLGLDSVADHLVEELSGGQQQRVAVARALAIDPDVVFADELTAELDHDWKSRVVEAVFEVAAGGGIVVVATHDPEIAEACDRVFTIADGQLS